MEENRLTQQAEEQGIIDVIKEENGIDGLFAAVEDIEARVERVDIIRDGNKFFGFDVQPLDSGTFDEIRDRNTPKKRNRAGVPIRQGIKLDDYMAEIIFTATTSDDRQRLWLNPEVKKRLGAVGYQVIKRVLYAGELEEVYEFIEKISGYDNDLSLGDTVKN